MQRGGVKTLGKMRCFEENASFVGNLHWSWCTLKHLSNESDNLKCALFRTTHAHEPPAAAMFIGHTAAKSNCTVSTLVPGPGAVAENAGAK